MPEPRHWLVVTDGEPRVEHETCPTREGRYGRRTTRRLRVRVCLTRQALARPKEAGLD
jgi:hypothetical protein